MQGVLVGPAAIDMHDANFCLNLILSIYYLMDMTYPATFGQFLGALQTLILNDNFSLKSKKCDTFVKYIQNIV
jgi:hypothetical protein